MAIRLTIELTKYTFGIPIQRTKIPKINDSPIDGANKASILIYIAESANSTSFAPKNVAICSLHVNPKTAMTNDNPSINKHADLKISWACLLYTSDAADD